MKALSEKWLDSNVGAVGASLDDMDDARARIIRLDGSAANPAETVAK